ncbi:MAG: MFS transporter, partial [SAR202 cluster bacterium]|nr:MFS transporter [SAR202 cluster bacterium]
MRGAGRGPSPCWLPAPPSAPPPCCGCAVCPRRRVWPGAGARRGLAPAGLAWRRHEGRSREPSSERYPMRVRRASAGPPGGFMSSAARPIAGRGWLVAALMLTMALAALDSTIVSTALPSIVGNLGGLSFFSWVFSVYLLASTVTVPLYGKLADLYGRKPMLLFGVSLFLIGSALCGTSRDMTQLILFRAIQGLGAGAVIPIVMTIVGDLFPIEQRAKIQGLFSAVWGVSGIAGPAVGGVLTDNIGWRWVFYINLPLGMAAMTLVWAQYRESVTRRRHSLDYAGTVLLSIAITTLLYVLLQGADAHGWASLRSAGLLGAAAVFFVLFVLQERRAPEPVVPLWLFRNRVIAVASIGGVTAGAMQFAAVSTVPMFAQGVRGGDATYAGLILAPMSIGWPIAAIIAGRLILKRGYFVNLLVGATLLVVGAAGLTFVERDSSVFFIATVTFILGSGLGFSFSSFIISVQNAVDRQHRGIATASNQFFRTTGGSFGTAIAGALLNAQLARHLAGIPGVPSTTDANFLLDPLQRANLPADILIAAQRALASSLHAVFLAAAGLAIVLAVIAWFFPRGRAQDLDRSRGGA